MNWLKTWVSSQGGNLPRVLEGSPKMDTGVVFMFISSFAKMNNEEDQKIAHQLLILVKQARQHEIQPLVKKLASQSPSLPLKELEQVPVPVISSKPRPK